MRRARHVRRVWRRRFNMRKFSSYGPVSTASEYYAPREALVDFAMRQLLGDPVDEGGHYMTIWAPRQTGKTWTMLEVVKRLRQSAEFDVIMISAESAKYEQNHETILYILLRELRYFSDRNFPERITWDDFPKLFTRTYLSKPLILIIDEFDALEESFISKFASECRNLYLSRKSEAKPSSEKTYLLHGLALIGIRSVLGIENTTGSPFNVQRSVRIPNLTFDEVKGMFDWYQRESGQTIAPDVVERLFAETSGQPGLTGWLGELLTETYNEKKDAPITMREFDRMYAYATKALPNSNLINIISKAKQPPHKEVVLRLFQTKEPIEFRYNDPNINFLYMHGVIDRQEGADGRSFVKFANAFVQRGLFDYFSGELFRQMGNLLLDPFDDLSDIFVENALRLPPLLARYQAYLTQNSRWLFQDAPRRADLRIYEAVYHFNLYLYLHQFLRGKGANVWPEFPTGNGKIDLIITYRGQMYGIELKTFADVVEYRNAVKQAAQYGKQLRLQEITLLFFIEAISDEHRHKFETPVLDDETGVTVTPVFVATGV